MKHVLLLIFTSLFIFSSCKKPTDDDSKVNTLNVGLLADIPTLDPANSYDTVSGNVIYQVYETMYEYEYLKRPYTLKPLLAESMPTIDKSGLTYTFKIKKNIQYHDDPSFGGKTRFVTAQDFITQIKRIAYIPTKSEGWWLFEEKIVGLDQFRKNVGSDIKKFESETIEGLQAPDEHTLVVKLNKKYPQLIYAFAMTFTSPIPIETMKHYQNDLTRNMIGTGPFQLGVYNDGLSVELKKNINYRDEKYPSSGDRFANENNMLSDAGKKIPFLEKIHFQIIKEDQPRWLNFLAKKIDYIQIPKDNFSSAITTKGDLAPELSQKGISLHVSPTLTYWWLGFNMKDKVLGKNKYLRLAIASAIDINRYISVFTNNVAQKANSIYPPGIAGYNPNTKLSFEYNVENAKEYLIKAGYPNGKGLAPITYDIRGSSTTARQTAEFIKAELDKIGIKVNVSVNTFPGYLQKARNGNLQFFLDGWALDYPDAENVLQLLVTKNKPPGPNSTYFSNKQFDEMFEKFRFLPDGEEKANLMKALEEIVFEEFPWAMLYYSRNYVLHHNYLKNFRPTDLGPNYYKYLRILGK